MSLMSALVMEERIVTTSAKAKAIRADVEKLITKAKDGSNAAKLVLKKSLSQKAFDKILKEIAPRFDKKQGGYVRLIKNGKRFGDDAPVVVMEWTEQASAIIPVTAEKKVKKVKPLKEVKPVKKTAAKKVVKKAVAKKSK
jgi:large subunit ribosomal protein L17